MRALRRSISTTPCVTPSQYSQLKAFFGLGKRRDASRPPSITPRLPGSARSGDPPSGSECTICRGESGDGEMTLKVPAEACTHPPQVCVGCLRQVILAAITSGDFITGIICPSSGCSQRLGYHDVQKCAAQEVFDRYDNLLMRDSLRADGNYVFCVNSSCTAGQEHTGGEDNNIVICYQCGTKQCFRHRTLWHEGLTCEQWDEQQRAIAKQQEQKTEHWIETGTKPCPGPRCGRRIQKIDGCDHMTCKRPGGCGHQFCWDCLAPWLQIISNDNSKHYDNCKYYSGRPGKNPAPPEVVAARAVRALPVPSTLPPTAGPSTEPSGSSHLRVQAEYGRPNQGSSLSEGPTPTPCGPVAGPFTNQTPIALQLSFRPPCGPHDMSAFTGDKATQTRRKNAEAQKLYRERKRAYEAGLPSRVQSLQERINLLEVQLACERPKQNITSWNLGCQLPPLYGQNLHPVNQTGRLAQHDSHGLGPLDARFLQSGSVVNALFRA